MLAWTSAGVAGVVGGGLLAACSSDGTTTSPTLTTTTTLPGVTSGDSEPARILELMSTPGPSFVNAPNAIAEEMGFYRDEAVTVSYEYPGTSIRGLQTLVGGTGTLSVADSFAVLVATAEGLDLRSIFLTSRGYVFGFAVNATSPIQEWSLDTVSGSRIGISDFSGGEVPVLRGALARLGLSEGGEDGVELVTIGHGGPETADAIESGSVDIIAASILDFEILGASGVDLRVITPDYIKAFPGQGYVTTPALLESNRGALTGILRAKAKATVFLQANPMAAAEIAIAAAPASAEGIPPEMVAALLKTVFADGNSHAFQRGNPDFRRIGAQDPASYDDFQRFLIETGTEDRDGTTLSAEVDLGSVLDNSLIDEVNEFDYEEIEALADSA